MAIQYFEISYPNFVLGAIIDPEEANQNNYDIVRKINVLVDSINDNSNYILNLDNVKADKVYVDNKLLDLSGAGRTTETIKQNAVNLINHKTSSDHDARYYTKVEVNDKLNVINSNHSNLINSLNVHKNSTDHDGRYYTKAELTPWLRGGDTSIREEVFIIINPNNGDGTFAYSTNGQTINGLLTPEGYQIFQLRNGIYQMLSNRLEVIINDTLRRSVASGGIIEISEASFALTSPEGSGAEITVKYYERLGMAAEYTLKLGSVKPPKNEGKNMWIDTRIA